jgi:hypothetical protein
MLARRSDPFPFEAVRDLLGILRALYSVAHAERQERRCRAISRIGRELRTAVDLALGNEPGTLGHAAAWERAERATRRLGDIIDCTLPLEPAVQAAAARVARPYGARRRKPPTR